MPDMSKMSPEAQQQWDALPKYTHGMKCPHCGGKTHDGYGVDHAKRITTVFTSCYECQIVTSKTETRIMG